jgi:nicotinamidase-related amidase
MKHPELLERKRAALVVVDMQEAFRPVIVGFAELVERISLMVKGALTLGIPIILTEQYPKGLGLTVTEIAGLLPEGFEPIEKLSFSACGASEFDLHLRERHIEQVIVCGIEAHICVSQTAHDLLARSYQVHLLADAVATRVERNRDIAIGKLTRAGAIISSVEMALFELCEASGTPEFKEIQNLVKTFS